MNMSLYVIYDRVAQESGAIMEAKNDGIALRKYQDALTKVPSPTDEFQLLHLADIDHETNKITLVETYQVVLPEPMEVN